MQSWDVYLHGLCIDTVYSVKSMEYDEVYRSLVDHDGYNPEITLIKS